jgi:putative MATE family efflux protein
VSTRQSLIDTPIPTALLRLAVPVLLSNLLRLAYQWVDAIWVRSLGVEATVAVTSSVFVMWAVLALNDVFAVGVVSYVSQLAGAGERRRAGVAALRGIQASFALGLVGTVAGLGFGREVFSLVTRDSAAIDTGASYLSIVLAGAPLPMVALTSESIMRACGDTRTPLLLDVFAVGLNAVLDPLFIFGFGPIPAMGVAGAAWATVTAQAVLVAGYLGLAARGHPAFPLARRAGGPAIRIAGLARVGLPAALIGALFSAVYLAFSRAASLHGTAAVAVIGIVNRVEAAQFMVSAAIGFAGAALVGQNLGAGRPDRARAVIRTGLGWVTWFSLVFTGVLLLWPEPFVRLFSADPEVVRLGVPYARILALCLPVNAWEIVVAESVMGSGHTRAMSAVFTSFSLLRIPLAFLVPAWTGSGVLGIAWVITVTCAARSLVILWWARRGTWTAGLARELHGAEGGVDARSGP